MSISISAIANTFKMRYRYRLSAIDLDRNITISIGDSLWGYRLLLSIIGDILREYR